jgi:hypothetical protein
LILGTKLNIKTQKTSELLWLCDKYFHWKKK